MSKTWIDALGDDPRSSSSDFELTCGPDSAA